MPNWCNNKLTIIGDKNELKQVQSLLFTEDEAFSFECAVPPPSNLYRENIGSEKREELNKLGIPNWYDWNCSNWGTKWDACNVYHMEITDTQIEVFFDTAWSPPEQWFYGLCNKIESKDIHIEMLYEEWGMWFAGSYVREKGWTSIMHNEGDMYHVDYSGNIVNYDQKMGRYRDLKGRFVCDDEVTTEASYGY